MLPENKVYNNYVKALSPKSPKLIDFISAFSIGGMICIIGELLIELYSNIGLSDKNTKILVPCTLIFAASLLTGIGIFDKLAKRAGAGTLVPITGFANAVSAPAIEFKNEGYILGVGANLFKIAGPVIAYGVFSSVIYGVIYYIVKLFCQ
ncbi:MAG: stage V sporulation protein AC [Clostridia bacterium]|nr:stage V sporulation protein AC [Clostridia bacterium]